jgi:hypothetical protein
LELLSFLQVQKEYLQITNVAKDVHEILSLEEQPCLAFCACYRVYDSGTFSRSLATNGSCIQQEVTKFTTQSLHGNVVSLLRNLNR